MTFTCEDKESKVRLKIKESKNMNIINEVNEWFEATTYPEKDDDPANKQGITLKGTRDDYLRMVESWRKLLESRDETERSLNGVVWKLTTVKSEKDGIKGTIIIGGANKCCLTIFKSGTIMLARAKANPFETVHQFDDDALDTLMSMNILHQRMVFKAQ